MLGRRWRENLVLFAFRVYHQVLCTAQFPLLYVGLPTNK